MRTWPVFPEDVVKILRLVFIRGSSRRLRLLLKNFNCGANVENDFSECLKIVFFMKTGSKLELNVKFFTKHKQT